MPPSEEFGCQCELLYEFGINDINSIPNSSKLRDDFDRIMQDALNKLKLEFLEVNVRRLEFRKEVSELDHKLETNKNVDMGSLRRIFFVKEPVKVKNEQLNELLNRMRQQNSRVEQYILERENRVDIQTQQTN